MNRRFYLILRASFALTALLLFAACQAGPTHSKVDGGGASAGNPLASKCGLSLEQEFKNTYHGFLQQKCASCHKTSGIGKGAFADDNVATAFNQFMLTGPGIVRTQALSAAHQPPFTGPVNQPLIDEIEPAWESAYSTFESCQADLDQNPGSPIVPGNDDPIVDDIDAVLITTAKLADAGSQSRTMSWNLDSETSLNSTGRTLSGVRFQIDVQEFTTPTGERSYQFSNPRIRAGSQAIRIRYVELIFNGQYQRGATTFKSADRRVPANAERKIANGTLAFNEQPNSQDTVSFGIGQIENIEFDPPTFQQLISANGVFGQNCAGCHGGNNPRAGLNITNYTQLVGQFYIAPFQPELSILYSRINNTGDPMPPSGVVATGLRKQVLDWILDGAPSGEAPAASAAGLPLDLNANNPTGTVLVTNVSIPNGVQTVNLVMSVTDPDQMAEAEVSINGNGAITLFGNQGVGGNDNQTVTVTIPTAAANWRQGQNSLVFRHLATQGATIQTVNISF